MRAELRGILLGVVVAVAAPAARAQSPDDGPVLDARATRSTAPLKVWVQDGELRLISWDRDSMVVRGYVEKSERFFFGGNSNGVKFGVELRNSSRSTGKTRLTAYVPRRSKVSVKTVSANILGSGVSGWFYTVSGAIHLSGAATSIEAESMGGPLDIDAVTPWLRARTGDGHLLLRGTPQDVDAGTIAGTLDIAPTGIVRGEFSSVSGDIHYVGSPAPGGIFEFTNHSGSVDLVLPQSVTGVFALSSIEGQIWNGFAGARPAGSSPRSMRLSFGRGGPQVTVRTFKGAIRLRPQ